MGRNSGALLDLVLIGDEHTSADCVEGLQLVEEAYKRYLADFGETAMPIIKALTGDIPELKPYISEGATWQ